MVLLREVSQLICAAAKEAEILLEDRAIASISSK